MGVYLKNVMPRNGVPRAIMSYVAVIVLLLACLIGVGVCLFSRQWFTLYRVSSVVCILGVSTGIYYYGWGPSTPQERQRYRFDSFARVRETGNEVKWFVDGEDYFAAVADAVVAAQHEIFITDWQMNPHIFLKRPEKGVNKLEWRLDKLLLKKAEKVRIYILLYWEVKSFLWWEVLNTGSQYVEKILSHKNIVVIRHPVHSTIAKHPRHLFRWSHHEKIVVVDRKVAFVGGIDFAFGRWDSHEHPLVDDFRIHPSVQEGKPSEEVPRQTRSMKYQRWIGKDYGNTFVGGTRTGFDEPLIDYIDRSKEPRMPWHDVACGFSGPAVGDVVVHFIQRYNFINQCSWYEWVFGGCRELLQENLEYKSSCELSDPSACNVSIQILRSVGEWSAGQPREDSIHKAYIEAIKESEHFIYIENQFFISSQPHGKPRKVSNEIQAAICDRIVSAYKNKEDFHVFIVLPLQPEMPGDWGTGSDKDKVGYWNYATLYSGEDSLMYKLKERLPRGANIFPYLSVYGLRTHDILNDKVVTEIIYVHSKIMIVDDRLTIIGSANINDRSMLGDRDSEVDVIIEDKEMMPGAMKGQEYPVGKFSHGLRCHLFREHLGLLGMKNIDATISPEDPLRTEFIYEVSQTASSNTYIYETVFRSKILPTNQVENKEDLKNWLSFKGLADLSQDEAKKELTKIRGNIVVFPSLFLKDELKPCTLDYLQFYVDNRGLQAGGEDNALFGGYGDNTFGFA